MNEKYPQMSIIPKKKIPPSKLICTRCEHTIFIPYENRNIAHCLYCGLDLRKGLQWIR